MALKTGEHNEIIRNEIFVEIQRIISYSFGVEENSVTLETRLYSDLNGDVLDETELIMTLEEEFDIQIDDDELLELPVGYSTNTSPQGTLSYKKDTCRSNSGFWSSLGSISSLSSSDGYGSASNYTIEGIVDLIYSKIKDRVKPNQTSKSIPPQEKPSENLNQPTEVKTEHQKNEVLPNSELNQAHISQSTYKALTASIRDIQYQAIKIEVLVYICRAGNDTPNPDVENLCDAFLNIYRNLLEVSERCFDSSPENIQSYIPALKEIVSYTNEFLLQINSALTTADPGVILIKELLANIISNLMNSNSDLTIAELKPLNIASSIMADTKSEIAAPDVDFHNLLRKCIGDVEKTERLIKYEIQKSPGRNRTEAIQAAIMRWEMDNR
jgi:acyl carrier protein